MTNDQDLFDPFVSLTFSEIKIVTRVDKVWNFHRVNKRMLNLVNKVIPIYAAITNYVGLMLIVFIYFILVGSTEQLLDGTLFTLMLGAFLLIILRLLELFFTTWFYVMMDPMQILVEAHDIMGLTTHFIISDKRSRIARIFQWRLGDRMELTRLQDQNNTPLLETSAKMHCLTTRELILKRVKDGTSLARNELFKCCEYKAPYQEMCNALICKPIITTIQCNLGKVDFVQSRTCGGRHDGNVIEPSEKLRPNQLAIQQNGFTWRDVFFETVGDLADIEEIVGEDIADAMGVVATVKEVKDEVKDIRDDYKDALSQRFKGKGYQKLGTSNSTWDVTFPPHMSDAQKSAVVLFVITQYVFSD